MLPQHIGRAWTDGADATKVQARGPTHSHLWRGTTRLIDLTSQMICCSFHAEAARFDIHQQDQWRDPAKLIWLLVCSTTWKPRLPFASCCGPDASSSSSSASFVLPREFPSLQCRTVTVAAIDHASRCRSTELYQWPPRRGEPPPASQTCLPPFVGGVAADQMW